MTQPRGASYEVMFAGVVLPGTLVRRHHTHEEEPRWKSEKQFFDLAIPILTHYEGLNPYGYPEEAFGIFQMATMILPIQN